MLSEKSLSPYSKSFIRTIFERLLIWTNALTFNEQYNNTYLLYYYTANTQHKVVVCVVVCVCVWLCLWLCVYMCVHNYTHTYTRDKAIQLNRLLKQIAGEDRKNNQPQSCPLRKAGR